jgi:hypothetical protein
MKFLLILILLLQNRLTLGYRELVKDFIDHGFIDQAKEVVERRLKGLTNLDEGKAHYAEALADVAQAEAEEIYASMYKEENGIEEQA